MAKKNRRPATRPTSTRPANRSQRAAETPGASAAPAAPKRAAVDFVARPFEGLGGESDWVALREIVPAGLAQVTTTAEHGAREVTIVSLLPDLVPALRRQDGALLVALQTVGTCGDASRDVANAILHALDLEPGDVLQLSDPPEPGPRLQDILEPGTLVAEVQETFAYWVGDDAENDPEVASALENANELMVPTVEVPVPALKTAPEGGLGTAYWCRMNGKEFLRWIVPAQDEETLDALARLHAKRVSAIEEGTRLIGAFRTCGVLVPVWELARGTEADELTDSVAAFAERLADALATTDPLTPAERGARSGLVSRQVRLR